MPPPPSQAIPNNETRQAIELMTRFAERTGDSRRYLWTDAFAVTNYLALARATGDTRFIERALRLIELVHQSLGRHRVDGPQRGWISGRSEADGAAHPTAGGLRIGKALDERPAHTPPDERLEWSRDGQYFHYLTKWMHALDQTARLTGDATFNCWARELAQTAHRAFVYTLRGGTKRMYWKLSVDLLRPVVPSMGQHDPLDGFVTYLQLQKNPVDSCAVRDLDAELADFAGMIDTGHLATGDPLGIGGLLVDGYRLTQLGREDDLVDAVLVGALAGLRHYARSPEVRAPAESRLAFRELGLAIGLAAVERMAATAGPRLRPVLGELEGFAGLHGRLVEFWLRPEHQQGDGWQSHIDINEVMLATSLVPAGFLTLHPQIRDVSILNFQRGARARSQSG